MLPITQTFKYTSICCRGRASNSTRPDFSLPDPTLANSTML